MMTTRAILPRALGVMVLAVSLAACTQLGDTSDAAATASKQAIGDTVDKWRDLFTYRRPRVAQLPQTRYCYHAQSDIVCYDSPQPGSTSPLVGYQDGANMAWFQPGGGSTGFSGGPATSRHPNGTIQPIGAPLVAVHRDDANPHRTTIATSASATDTVLIEPAPDTIAVAPNPPFKNQVR
jgi:hypothetical protein